MTLCRMASQSRERLCASHSLEHSILHGHPVDYDDASQGADKEGEAIELTGEGFATERFEAVKMQVGAVRLSPAAGGGGCLSLARQDRCLVVVLRT